MDLREYLLAEPATGIIRPVDCPEWDKTDDDGKVERCELEMREMDILTRAAWRHLSFVPVPGTDEPGKNPEMEWNQPRSNTALVALCTYYRAGEKAGTRVFLDTDLDLLLKLPGRHENAVNRLLNVATEINFLGANVAKVAAKNSKGSRKSGTSSK
jgi:hypothetical protein